MIKIGNIAEMKRIANNADISSAGKFHLTFFGLLG